MSRPGLCRVLIGIIVAIGVDLGAAAREMPMPAPLGRWTTANGDGVIDIGWCGATLCGRIVGIARAPGDPAPTDFQGRSQCGLTIITEERPTQDGTWLGHVIDPRDGRTYQAELWVDDAGQLKMRGFVGVPFLGRTETWHRFKGHLDPGCRIV